MKMMRRFVWSVLLASEMAALLAVTAFPAVAQQVIATVAVGNGPRPIAVDPVTNKIYVGNTGGSNVTVIDGATNHTSTLNVGLGPSAIAVNSVTNKIYVANEDATVTVIDGATNDTTSVSGGNVPEAIGVNPVTNKIYVVNVCGNDPNCQSLVGTVTVIDGPTNHISTVNVGAFPYDVAVNSVTNKIYVANQGDNSVTVIDGATNGTSTIICGQDNIKLAVNSVTNKIYVADNTGNAVTVIDGATNRTSTVNVGQRPFAIAVNSVTNQIYVVNTFDNTATAIDGFSNHATTVPVGQLPWTIGIDQVTDKIYVGNRTDNTITMIDGATNNTTTVSVGTEPRGIAVNPLTNRIYVTNRLDNTVSVIAGANSTALQFVATAPCRLVDTRNPNGEFGGPPIQSGIARSLPIPQQILCDIPSTAAAYSLNVTLVPISGHSVGFLTIWPTGEDQPNVSTMNSWDGRVKANAAIVPAGTSGAVSVFSSDTTNVVLDIDGYFEPVSSSTLAFYPLTPCRVADTRKPNDPLGGPYLKANQERDFPVLASSCDIPNSAKAYSLNFTVVPRSDQVWVFTAWPFGQSQPGTSTLNAPTGTVVANAAILPAGTSGKIATSASADTDLAIDINGYFAPAGEGGLSLYPVAPCRVLDTRKVGNGAPFTGQLNPPVNVVDSACGPSSSAQAFVLNATIVPAGDPVYVLTPWPDGGQLPHVSTLNAYDGAVTSNMAIVPTTNGSIDADAAGLTQLILDISGYFAP